ncbi:hypothetical protein [Amycolatopsis sacchari]|uniref:hypothetical protein n=1 Tax=Amycolatopsis sacchari TaxID=115433 RepID=UPI0011782FD7|nr:hypothetical protein [Amycolatopsis sacchari]
MENQIKDATLWELVEPVARDALHKMHDAYTRGLNKETYWGYTTIIETPEGRQRTHKSPLKYSSAIGPEKGIFGRQYTYAELDGFSDLLAYTEKTPEYRSFLSPKEADTVGDRLVLVGTADLPLEIAERHAHCVGWEYDSEFLKSTYIELERWWIGEGLTVDLIIPILGSTFNQSDIPMLKGRLIETDVGILAAGQYR